MVESAPRIASAGEVLWDIYPTTAHLGGAAANVSFHASQLGAHSLLISRVGDDPQGRQALRQLSLAGVDVSGVGTEPRGKTGYVQVSFAGNEPRFEIGEGVAWDRLEIPPHLQRDLASYDALCFGTLAQRTPLVHGRLASTLEYLRGLGYRRCLGGHPGARPLCVLDLNLRPPFTDLETILGAVSWADVIKMNDKETEWLKQAVGTANAVGWLLERYPVELVALTHSERGATLMGRTIRAQAVGMEARGGDSVGAGDAFVAALAYGLCRGASALQVLEFANRRAAWVASQDGAMPSGVGPRWS